MTRCRLCDSRKLARFLDLGFSPPADDFLTEERLNKPETYYPLRVVRCDECSFIQLDYVVDQEVLYQNDYPYESSVTATGRTHFDRFAESVIADFSLESADLVVDIGSNVGVLLDGFKRRGMGVLGVDPAKNIAKIANKSGIPTISEFFSPDVARKITRDHRPARIITASNVFAHVDDLDSLVQGVLELLDEKGIFVIEAPYLVHLIDNLEYDTIYHEHLSYIAVSPLVRFFKKHDIDIFNLSEEDIHGGSIRIFTCRKGQQEIDPAVQSYVKKEEDSRNLSIEGLKEFSQCVSRHRDELTWLLKSLKQKGNRIAGVSAPAKGMTLLNYCKIGQETLEFLTEKSTLKINRYAPGSHLPVVPDSALLSENIDYALLLAWNFKDEIIDNLSDFRAKGGKFIIPIPVPTII